MKLFFLEFAVTREEYKATVEKAVKEKCNKGEHSFQQIFESGCYMESIVVRWCMTCGSVVVDVDYDCRTNPGEVMKMRSPSITKALS